ncbi:MAG: 23S rRNA (pseudouridine(1915)-N(3))-methyltransferase RlmH [Candidatus Puniceispirillum sp.]|nr:23S rRNA (pseudouridine(1915)-N(3))-methyltransferase RlmH [Candidatus Puniceispirillum sp.]
MQIKIRAIGRMKAGPLEDLIAEYAKRMRGEIMIEDYEAKKKGAPAQVQEEEVGWLLKGIAQDAFMIALDERGKAMTSPGFAKVLDEVRALGKRELVFIIGGADGLTEAVRSRANLLLSFGTMVWPHKLVRVMLMEQLYRAQQIAAGHPYHRD